MPLKRTYSTSTTVVPSGYQQTKKRRFPAKKRARRYPTSGTVGRPFPFPVRMRATLRYVETLQLSSVLVPIANANIACNSIYDPNLSGSGHQPYGHDTYSAIYNQYTVLRARIKVTLSRRDTNTACTYGVGIEDSTSSAPTLTTWAERPTYKTNLGQSYMPNNWPLYLTWERNKRFPHNDTYRDLSAPFGANPSEIEVFNIVAEDPNGVTALGTVYVLVEVNYDCEFYELQDLGSS